MPSQTHETKIKITADARQAQKTAADVGKGLSKALNPKEADKLTATMERMEKLLKRIVANTRALKDPFKATSASAKVYNKLLEETETRLKRITQLEARQGTARAGGGGGGVRIAGGAGGGGGMAGGGGGGRRGQGFVAGVGQGLGLGTYIPTGSEMLPRMVGQLASRALHTGAAPFLQPGVGGLSTALQGVPLVGNFLSGALQQAYSAFGSAVAYHRAQYGNLAYMAEGWGTRRNLGPAPEATAAYQAAQERNASAQAASLMAQRELNQAEATQRGLARHPTASSPLTRAERIAQRNANAIRYAQVQGPVGAFGTAVGAGRPMDALTDARRYVASSRERLAVARREAELAARALGSTPKPSDRIGVDTGLPGAGEGVAYGLDPTQMAGLLGQFMGARSGTYGEVRRSRFRDVMAAHAAHGVSGTLAGGFARIGTGTGGGVTGRQGLAGVLQHAVAQGMKGSEVTEYLQALVEQGSRAERQGVKFDATEFVRMSATLTGIGFRGLQASRVVGGLNQTAAGVSARGVAGGSDMLMLRAAGFSPEQGPEGYAAAIEKLEGGLTGDMLSRLLGMVARGSRTAGFGGPKTEALFARRALGAMGVSIGSRQARSILDAWKGGPLQGKSATDIQEMIAAGEAPGASEGLQAMARSKVRVGAGLTVAQAGMETMRVGAGAGMAGLVISLERVGLSTVGVLKNFGKELQGLTALMQKTVNLAGSATKGGLAGIQERVVNAVSNEVFTWTSGFGQSRQ